MVSRLTAFSLECICHHYWFRSNWNFDQANQKASQTAHYLIVDLHLTTCCERLSFSIKGLRPVRFKIIKRLVSDLILRSAYMLCSLPEIIINL